MDIFSILTLLGGLALFLYGMDLMSSGLKASSGGRMKALLSRMTSSRGKGVLLGLLVTAVIQSSSATTVMVVGFVGAGIMSLYQAVWVIMGANVGTTLTSWLLSLSGLSGAGLLVQLLRPAAWTPIVAMAGVLLLTAAKTEHRRRLAHMLLGLAILMYGMQTMSGAMKPLADMPGVGEVFLLFRHPLLGMLAGALLTAILQSSSASVGILQALCTSGVVSVGAAIPIIMGQNIGTCGTALLSSLGAGKHARRAAMIHLFFNVIGTVVWMSLFYGLNAWFSFDFLQEQISPAGIAAIHSIFNIAATILLFPFGRTLVKLAAWSVPEAKRRLGREMPDLSQ